MKKWGHTNLAPKKIFLILFLGGFLIGIIIANALGKEYINDFGVLSDYFISKYEYTNVDKMDLFFYILEHRIPDVVILWISGATILGVIFAWIWCGWLGFSIGLLLSAATIKLGLKGILLIVMALIPQYIFYVPGFFLLIHASYQLCVQRYYPRLKQNNVAIGKKYLLEYIAILIMVVLLFVIGAFTESYLNVGILKKILKII